MTTDAFDVSFEDIALDQKIRKMKEASELALIPEIGDAREVFKDGGTDALIEACSKEAWKRADGLDISRPKDVKALKSLVYQIARTESAIDDAGKTLKESLMVDVKIIDSERRKVRDAFAGFKAEIRAPLTEWEQRDKKRIASHEDALRQLGELGENAGHDSVLQIDARLNAIKPFHDRDWEEFNERARKVEKNALHWLGTHREAALKREAEAAELARLRKEAAEREQREREERIAKEAAERLRLEVETKAQREAERVAIAAEREKQEVVEKLERERKAAEDRAHAAELRQKAEQAAAEERARKAAIARKVAEEKARIDAERAQADAVLAERKRIESEKARDAEIERKRQAQREHRDAVEQEALDGFIKVFNFALDSRKGLKIEDVETIAKHLAEILLEAIGENEIPHIKINY